VSDIGKTVATNILRVSSYFLGLNHLPPDINEINTKPIAIHVNAVWSVAMPIARKASPSMRNMLDERPRRFCFVIV